MHQLKSEYLNAVIQYLAKRPYSEVHQLIAMMSSATKVPETQARAMEPAEDDKQAGE